MHSGNRFRDTTLSKTETVRAQKAFAGIKYFKLHATLLPWEDVSSSWHRQPQTKLTLSSLPA
jgi:hypothetical protein